MSDLEKLNGGFRVVVQGEAWTDICLNFSCQSSWSKIALLALYKS